jgi:hypothetical protein
MSAAHLHVEQPRRRQRRVDYVMLAKGNCDDNDEGNDTEIGK